MCMSFMVPSFTAISTVWRVPFAGMPPSGAMMTGRLFSAMALRRAASLSSASRLAILSGSTPM